MKICPECALNFIDDNEDICTVCKAKKVKPKMTVNISKKKGNHELNGQRFVFDLMGYGLYLVARGYSLASENENSTTCLAYATAIAEILKIEKISFEEMTDNIGRLVMEYSKDGIKKELGETQHGTWRNALKRMEEFVEYQYKYLGRKRND